MAIKMEYDPNDSTWKPTVNIIRDTTDADEWTPHPDWPDIKYILQNDTYGYAGSFIELITDDYDTISLSGGVAYRTSDGAYYTSATVTHTWDKSKDVSCARGYKTRWVITYSDNSTLYSLIKKQKNLLWLVFNCNLSNVRAGVENDCVYCEAIEFINNKSFINMTSASSFYTRDMSLQGYPIFNTQNITTFYSAFSQNHLLVRKSSVDLSSCISTERMFYYAQRLRTVDGVLDMNSVTTAANMFTSCDSLVSVCIKNLKVSLLLSSSSYITHASLLYLLQNLQTVTAGSQTLTLGATNLAKLTDTEKALATDKGWLLA